MKRNAVATTVIAAVLGFCCAWGAAGCMISGFSLNVKATQTLLLVLAAAAVISAVAFRRKWGGIFVLGCLAALSGWLWYRTAAGEQILRLIYRLSTVYDRAYGWGVVQLVEGKWNEGFADIPMAMLGTLVAVTVSWTVCRRKSGFWAVAATLLPLCLCLVVTDTVPEEKYLFILLLASVLLLLTSQVRRSSENQANRLTAMALIPVAAALAALFLAVPRNGYINRSEEFRDRLLSWVENLPENVEEASQRVTATFSGSEDGDVDLAAMGRRIELKYPVMDVTAETGGRLYLREQDYDFYNGTSWQSTPIRSEEFSCKGVDLGLVLIQTRGEKELLFLPYYPTGGMTIPGGRLENEDNYTQYTLDRTGLPDNWRSLTVAQEDSAPQIVAGVGTPGEENLLRYRNLPGDTLIRAKALLETILTGDETATEAADKIASFVRNSARYDRDTARMPAEETDFALWFLEEAETGYCVHFATAATVLLRAAGVEARYVSGYTLTAKADMPVTVTGADAHAWAEYYEPALDTWILLEATPGEGIPSGETEEQAETQPTQPPQTQPQAPTAPSQQSPLPTQPDAVQQEEPSGRFRWLANVCLAVLLLAALLAAVEGQRIFRLRQRKKRTGTANAQALARWQEAELFARLLKTAPPEELEQLAIKAKFSQHTLTEQELALFDTYLEDTGKQLRQLPLHRRLAAKYIFAAY